MELNKKLTYQYVTKLFHSIPSCEACECCEYAKLCKFLYELKLYCRE